MNRSLLMLLSLSSWSLQSGALQSGTLLPLLAGLVAAQEPAAEELLTAQRAQSFRIGTWNLEFLGAGGNYRNNLPPRTEADYQALGRKVVELGVCVLAVQEINDEATLRKVAAGAGPQWDVVLGTSGEWDDKKTAQRVGFVYDKNAVDLLFAEELGHLPREYEGLPIFHRVPVTAGWKHKATGADFRLVTVHLKAGQKADDQKKRRGEATALAGWLDTLQRQPGEDQDIVLLGDFNSTYGTEPEQLLEHSGLRQFLDQTSASPTIMHFAEPIDQVVVANGCLEVRRQSLLVDHDCDGMPKETWRQTYSDHFPVTLQFRANGDDDPQATFWRGAPEFVLPPHLRRPNELVRVIGKPAPWPFVAGRKVHVLAGGVAYAGTLARDVAQDGTGWVVFEYDGNVVSVHATQVASLRLP